jgi:hypothetical protein
MSRVLLGGAAAASARFNKPYGVAVDATAKVYVADRDNHLIRLISAGVVSTLAGSAYGYLDGPAASAKFANPYDLALGGGTVYVADKLNSRVRRVAAGAVTTYAGSLQGYQNGAVSTAKFKYIYGLGVTASGEILVADGGNHRIRKIASGQVTTLAGDGTIGLLNGPAASARFNSPMDAEADAAGKVYIADHHNNCIRLYTP